MASRREFLKDSLAIAGAGALAGCAPMRTAEAAETLIVNGRIATLDPKQPNAEAIRRVREQARRTPPPHWVQVIGGWTWAQFAEKRYPTLEEINAAAGDTPCMIMHLYDRAWLNRAAIRVLGWEKEVPKLFGGYIERDAGGSPTGLVMSTTSLASLVAVWLRLPRLSP